jgi:hypothetical protein
MLPIPPFASVSLWEEWLSTHHAQPDGVWLKIAKKATGIASVTYEEALDVALCYGWIDGQRKAFDSSYFVQRFAPRRSRSIWSRCNVDKVAGLTNAGRMQPSGLAQVEAAKEYTSGIPRNNRQTSIAFDLVPLDLGRNHVVTLFRDANVGEGAHPTGFLAPNRFVGGQKRVQAMRQRRGQPDACLPPHADVLTPDFPIKLR